MDQGTLFSEMKLRGKPLKDCEIAIECNGNNYRLYVERGDNKFYAMAVEFVSCSDSDIWNCELLRVEQLFEVTAYFDGVRHLEFNRYAGNMAGYIYYPDMDGLILLLQKVRELEAELCDKGE